MTKDDTAIIVRSKHDIYRIINQSEGGNRKTSFILLAAMASFFVESWALVGFGVGVPSMIATFHLNAMQIGLLNAVVGVGAFLAAVFGGYFVDRLGRLKVFFLDMLCFVMRPWWGPLRQTYSF